MSEYYLEAKKIAKSVHSLGLDGIEKIAELLEKYVRSLPPEKQEVAICNFHGRHIPRKLIPHLFRVDPEFREEFLKILRT